MIKYTETEKWCNSCKLMVKHEDFTKLKSKTHGLSQYCRNCQSIKWKDRAQKVRAWREKHIKEKKKDPNFVLSTQERMKKNALWNMYRLTFEEYNKLLKEQNYKCKICNTSIENTSEAQVDHCHDTGKIRGLLCRKCNVGLGCFQDNLDLFRKAMEYLENN